MSIKKADGNHKAPNKAIPDMNMKADDLLPFGQERVIKETTSHKKKVQDRALKARYQRKTQAGQYLALLSNIGKHRLIRMEEFMTLSKYADKTARIFPPP